jgi:site-specific recombinase XerD
MATTSKGDQVECGIWRHPSGSGYIAEVSYRDARTGRRVRDMKKIHRLDLAREWRQTRKADALRGDIRRDRDLPKPTKFGVFAQRYLTEWSEINKAPSSHQRDINSLKHLNQRFGTKYLSDIRRVDVEGYIAGRRRDACAAGTLNREFSCLKNLLRKAVEWELLDVSPAAGVGKVREEVKEFEWLTENECLRLISACTAHLAPIVVLALNTGMRRGELLQLEWKDVDFQQGLITLGQTKNGEIRHIPMNDQTRRTLSEYSTVGRRIVNGIVSPYVFSSSEGKPLKGFRNGLNAAVERAHIKKHIRPHDLRHTFASHLVMKGVDLRTVAKLLGHRDIRVTMRYAHLAPEHLRSAVSVLDQEPFVSTNAQAG